MGLWRNLAGACGLSPHIRESVEVQVLSAPPNNVKKEYNAMTGHKDDVYEFDLKTEETGEFICTVEIDQAGLEIIIQKGFIAILTEYLEKQEK